DPRQHSADSQAIQIVGCRACAEPGRYGSDGGRSGQNRQWPGPGGQAQFQTKLPSPKRDGRQRTNAVAPGVVLRYHDLADLEAALAGASCRREIRIATLRRTYCGPGIRSVDTPESVPGLTRDLEAPGSYWIQGWPWPRAKCTVLPGGRLVCCKRRSEVKG